MLSIVRLAVTTFVLALAQVSKQQSPTEWNNLNVTVEGILIQGIPFARPCFDMSNTTGGSYSVSKCSSVIQNYLSDGEHLGYSFFSLFSFDD